jgi:myosin heavy subunit
VVEIGHICYPKLASTKYGDVAREELSSAIAREVERLISTNLAKPLGEILVRCVGLDLDSPSGEVSPGDTIVFPGGAKKSFSADDSLSAESFAKEIYEHTKAIVDDKTTEGVKGAVEQLSALFLTVKPFYDHFGLIDDLDDAKVTLKSILTDIQTAIDKVRSDNDDLSLVDALKVALTPSESKELEAKAASLEGRVLDLLDTIKKLEAKAQQDRALIESYKETTQDLQEHLDLERGRVAEQISKYEALKAQLSETSETFTRELNRERNENRSTLYAPLSRLASVLVGTGDLTEEVIASLEEKVLSAAEIQRSLTVAQERVASLENAKASESSRVQRLETKVRDLASENQILNSKCDRLWQEGQSQVDMLTAFILRMTGEETYSVEAFDKAMGLLGEAPEF